MLSGQYGGEDWMEVDAEGAYAEPGKLSERLRGMMEAKRATSDRVKKMLEEKKVEEKPKKKAPTPQGIRKQGRIWLDELFVHMNLTVEVGSSYDKSTKTISFDLEGAGSASLRRQSATAASERQRVGRVSMRKQSVNASSERQCVGRA